MGNVYNRKARRQSANLSINSDLLKATRESGVNLSAVLEEALAQRVAAAKRETWKKDNSEAIAAYNEFLAHDGAYTDNSRSF